MRNVTIVLLLLTGLAAAPLQAGRPKALVYMIDGLRADAAEAVNAPVWQALKANQWAEGYWAVASAEAANDYGTAPNSAPNHTAIATGLPSAFHKVVDNASFPQYDAAAAPTFLQILQNHGKWVLFAYSWQDDKVLTPSRDFTVFAHGDAENHAALAALLQSPEIPDALLVFDDAPDHSGHASGFCPFHPAYLDAVRQAMQRVGNLLEIIRRRPGFAEEEWLIVICADHGGLGRDHGMRGGQASTVPLLFASRSLKAKQFSRNPDLFMIAPAVLEHFGLLREAEKLPGRNAFSTAVPAPETASSAAPAAVAPEALTSEQREGYTLILEALPQRETAEEFPLLSASGMTLTVTPEGLQVKLARAPESHGGYLIPDPAFLQLGPVPLAEGGRARIFLSVAPGEAAVLLQKHPDGHIYWLKVADPGLSGKIARIAVPEAARNGQAAVQLRGLGMIDRPLPLEQMRKLSEKTE